MLNIDELLKINKAYSALGSAKGELEEIRERLESIKHPSSQDISNVIDKLENDMGVLQNTSKELVKDKFSKTR